MNHYNIIIISALNISLLQGMDQENVFLLIDSSEANQASLAAKVKKYSHESVLQQKVSKFFRKLQQENNKEALTSLQIYVHKKANEVPSYYKKRLGYLIAGTSGGVIALGSFIGIITTVSSAEAWCNSTLDSVRYQINKNRYTCYNIPKNCTWDGSESLYPPTITGESLLSTLGPVITGIAGVFPFSLCAMVEFFRATYKNTSGEWERYKWQIVEYTLHNILQKKRQKV